MRGQDRTGGGGQTGRTGQAGPVHVLIVDDDRVVRTMLVEYLEAEGLRVSEATDGEALQDQLEQSLPDIILLDLVLPGEDGLSILRHIHGQYRVAIIIMTSRNDVIDRVAGLEAGADDYIGKPVHPRELLARIRTVMRRSQAIEPPAREETQPVFQFAGFEMNPQQRRLSGLNGRDVPLTASEFNLLQAFVTHAGQVLERDRLMDLVKGREWAAFDRSIDQQVARLRRRIEPDPTNPSLIKSVRGVGYLLAATVTTKHLGKLSAKQ